jgi:hypothetical protein
MASSLKDAGGVKRTANVRWLADGSLCTWHHYESENVLHKLKVKQK